FNITLSHYILLRVTSNALKKIRGIINVDNEFDGIVKSIGQHSGNWSELLSPSVRPALILGFGLALLRSFAGFSVILYGYSPTIFQFAGFESASEAILATVAVGIVNVIMTIVAMKFIDSWGRRPLLLIGLMGSFISLGVLGLAFMFPESGKLTGWLALGSLLLYVGSWSFGPRPVFWLLISEIYPLKIRGLGMSVGTLTNWGTNCLVTLTFLTLTHVLGRPGTFWFYGLAGICTWLLVYFFVPETKGQSLEKIEDHFRSGKHPREMGK
ncbi:MFS transporter, partial [Desulfobacterota bacterium AH_259_B03_O07]|nr:MFS transporter [Desulfobacterota bacterium AH_259_B03_O07]